MQKKSKMPTAYTVLFIIIIIVAILTWVIPSGQYNYIENEKSQLQPISDTYHRVEPNRQGLFDIVMAPFKGFYDAIEICLFILMVGGFLGIVMETGAICSSISNIVTKLKGKEKYLIPILMCLFGLGGTTFGMAEETIAFYPLIIPVFIAAGYDTITAVSVILLGSGVGVLASTINPFATGIASGFAGISIGNGLLVRIVQLIVSEIIAVIFVMKYARKVKTNPEKSIVSDMYESNKLQFTLKSKNRQSNSYNTRKRIIIYIFIFTFLIMIYSVIPFNDLGITFLPTLGWFFKELSALFFISGIIIGVIAKLNEKEIVNKFIAGSQELLGVVFIIGISRGITFIMNEGLITDTILNYGEQTLSGAGKIPFIILTYLFYIPLSVLIPSTSGLATVSMPIMAPLGNFAGITKDMIVTAYQSASGIINLITPTSAVVMGGLAIAKIPYNKWLKFTLKIVGILFLTTILVLIIAVTI